MKTRHFQLATFLLIAFLQILPVQAQRSSGSRGVDHANLPHGYNIMWDLEDGVLRIWAVEDFENPWTYAPSSWSDCILEYKAYLENPGYPWEDLQPQADDWYNYDKVNPHAPAFTETPRYSLREHVRQIQIDGSIYYIGSYAFTYFRNCRSVILHNGVEEFAKGNFGHFSMLEHVYLPGSLGCIGPVCFTSSPNDGPLSLVCDHPEPLNIYKTYYTFESLIDKLWTCFSGTKPNDSFVHLPTAKAVFLYGSFSEFAGFYTFEEGIRYRNSWRERFTNSCYASLYCTASVSVPV